MNRDQCEVAMLRERREEEGTWPKPPPMDSWAFLVTEVGEVGDVLMRLGHGQRDDYVRTHLQTVTTAHLRQEIADVYLMLITLANHFEINLSAALDDNIRRLESREE